MREARGFAIVKYMLHPRICRLSIMGIGVVVRGAKAQHHENKDLKKRKGVPIGQL